MRPWVAHNILFKKLLFHLPLFFLFIRFISFVWLFLLLFVFIVLLFLRILSWWPWATHTGTTPLHFKKSRGGGLKSLQFLIYINTNFSISYSYSNLSNTPLHLKKSRGGLKSLQSLISPLP